MIHSFSCKNFYSFSDLTTVSFAVNNKAPVNNGYFTALSENRLSKIETVVGPNASGKTNLLKVLPFLKWLIMDSLVKTKPEDLIVVQPFAFGKAKNEPTELSIVFEINGKVYSYSIILNKQKILSEELKLTSFVKEKKSSKKIFSRSWDEATSHYNFTGDNFDVPNLENLLRKNASVIGSVYQINSNHKEIAEIVKFWQHIETNVIEAGWLGDYLLINRLPQWFEALVFYSENDNLKKEAEKLISRFDLGLKGIKFSKEKEENRLTIKDVYAVHLFNGEEQSLPILYESSGTKQLFVLLKSILQVLAEGGVAVLDEFDVNLHPEMVLSLYELFIQPETNSKNAQILFSTHSLQILSKLDKYQIILTEKNKNGISESWRLDDVSGVRADDNYYTKYIAGAYGAVPKL